MRLDNIPRDEQIAERSIILKGTCHHISVTLPSVWNLLHTHGCTPLDLKYNNDGGQIIVNLLFTLAKKMTHSLLNNYFYAVLLFIEVF